jgi:hypothetical protein
MPSAANHGFVISNLATTPAVASSQISRNKNRGVRSLQAINPPVIFRGNVKGNVNGNVKRNVKGNVEEYT